MLTIRYIQTHNPVDDDLHARLLDRPLPAAVRKWTNRDYEGCHQTKMTELSEEDIEAVRAAEQNTVLPWIGAALIRDIHDFFLRKLHIPLPLLTTNVLCGTVMAETLPTNYFVANVAQNVSVVPQALVDLAIKHHNDLPSNDTAYLLGQLTLNADEVGIAVRASRHLIQQGDRQQVVNLVSEIVEHAEDFDVEFRSIMQSHLVETDFLQFEELTRV
ncbi:hypothetical protein PG996_000008 [Apiospora saccharicola]|uniref:Uncharacterized protein n=1 Tax=Apiospora saccharicola TaxID=335842 RepID=A0ABR1WCI9_9PEZI